MYLAGVHIASMESRSEDVSLDKSGGLAKACVSTGALGVSTVKFAIGFGLGDFVLAFFSSTLIPGAGAGTDWSWRSGCEPVRETEKLHGFPSIGEILCLKSHGYCEYGSGEAAAALSPNDAELLFLSDDGLFSGDCDLFVRDCRVFASGKSDAIMNKTEKRTLSTHRGCSRTRQRIA